MTVIIASRIHDKRFLKPIAKQRNHSTARNPQNRFTALEYHSQREETNPFTTVSVSEVNWIARRDLRLLCRFWVTIRAYNLHKGDGGG
jgi:hypothetical protein